jgi:hypothetical protein
VKWPAYVNDPLSDFAAGRNGSNSKSIIYNEDECDKSESREGDRPSCGLREVKGERNPGALWHKQFGLVRVVVEDDELPVRRICVPLEH